MGITTSENTVHENAQTFESSVTCCQATGQAVKQTLLRDDSCNGPIFQCIGRMVGNGRSRNICCAIIQVVNGGSSTFLISMAVGMPLVAVLARRFSSFFEDQS